MSSTDKAIYMNNFPHPIHGSLQPLRLGGESNLKEGETMSDAWDRMHKEAVEWIRTRIGGEVVNAISQWQPQSDAHQATTTYASPQPIIIDKSIERLEIAIENADTIEKLQKVKEENPVMTVGVNAQWNAKYELLKRHFQC